MACRSAASSIISTRARSPRRSKPARRCRSFPISPYWRKIFAPILRAPWPQKQRELHNHHFDSTIWNDFKFRDDDIVIATYGKSGTTWVQQSAFVQRRRGRCGRRAVPLARSPRAGGEARAVEAQAHRRFIKTHLPIDALVFSPRAKYVCIGRDGRDVIFSI
jgi:aryl sulfotransferase